MRRTNHVLGAVAAMAAIAAVAAGCEIVPDPDFAGLETTLRLTVVRANRTDVAGSLEFAFELTNLGTSTAKACLGPSRTVASTVASWSGSSSTLVDHSGCTREFAIDAGSNLAWRETLDVLHLPAGLVETSVDVQIVNPRRCGRWGNCAAFELTSNEIVIP